MLTQSLVPSGVTVTPELADLRRRVRDVVSEALAAGRFSPGVDAWITGWDPDFSRELASHGWIGMTIPVEYGGHGRTFVERFVVTEELLAAGAPVAAHWVADRQAAPSLLRFGSEEQKRYYLPRIAAGECYFAIGMSEPDSGSDLASVRTRARPVDGGWRITGTKVWTSGAHAAEAFVVLARSSPLDPAQRHSGLSQFIVDLGAEGVQVQPIVSMTGQHHFNEVHLEDVFVPDDRVLGEIGGGWNQVTSELAYERSGPERFLCTFPLYRAQVRHAACRPDVPADPAIGRALARLRGLHQMSLAVNAAVARGETAEIGAAVVKVLGTAFEGDLVANAQLGGGLPPDDPLLGEGLLQRPGFTLRGGTNEVLRGVIARGMGLR
ncbi:acyl-CoA dehydrogenase family protein [Dietzia psychralcaliphila]|uniref:acyl-CoA dehydrogenase family protein n=1 Tax=Dietzia psychralcaliphila TaxID=139021 RepID=UPI003555E5CC